MRREPSVFRRSRVRPPRWLGVLLLQTPKVILGNRRKDQYFGGPKPVEIGKRTGRGQENGLPNKISRNRREDHAFGGV